MLTTISTLLVFGFVGIAVLGHVLLFTAIMFGNSESSATDTTQDTHSGQAASAV